MFNKRNQNTGQLKREVGLFQKLGLVLMVMLGAPVGSARAQVTPTIQLTSPNGGETFQAGQTYTITWSSSGLSGSAGLVLMKAGAAAEWIIGVADVSVGQFDWRLCDRLNPGSDYKIDIRFLGGSTLAADSSDAPFRVISSAPPTQLSLLTPHAGEVIAAGTTYHIRWSSLNPTGDVELILLKGGLFSQLIGLTSMSSGQYDWVLCPSLVNGGDYSIEVISIDDLNCNPYAAVFEGDHMFTVTGSISPPAQPQLTMTSPAYYQVVQNGTTVPIRWAATNPTGTVDIYLLSVDQLFHATGVKHLGSAAMGDGRFDWTIGTCERLPMAEYHMVYLAYNCGQQSISALTEVIFQADGLTDSDGDGVCDRGDICPDVANVDQADCDHDGIGDACDSSPGFTRWYRDEDGDSVGDPTVAVDACQQPQGFVARAGDCNDQDPAIHSSAAEICDGKDNDCDGVVDNGACPQPVVRAWFRDQDNDSHGDANYRVDAAETPPGYVPLGDDCDDFDATIHPSAVETCGDSRDNNCNGQIDEGPGCCTTQLCGSCVVSAMAASFAGIAGMKRQVRRRLKGRE